MTNLLFSFFKNASAFLMLLVSCLPGQAQQLSGKEAAAVIPGSEKIVFNKKVNSVSFVVYLESSQPDITAIDTFGKEVLKMQASDTWQLYKTDADQLGMVHYRYKQFYNSIPVEGGVYYFHTKGNKIVSANGDFFPGIAITSDGILSMAEAFHHAMNSSKNKNFSWENDAAKKQSDIDKTTLVVLPFKNNYYLTWKTEINTIKPAGSMNVYVDAKNGTIIKQVSKICHTDVPGTAHTGYSGTQTITTDHISNQYYLRETGRGGGIQTINMNTGNVFTDSDNNWNNVNSALDQYATDAHWAMEMTYDYYYNTFARNSYDDAGGIIKIFMHDVDDGVNAHWSPNPDNEIHIGDGDGVDYNPLSSLDIMAHEFTHGITEYSAGLEYFDESGALNESFSDIFGNTIRFLYSPSQATWYVGDEIIISGSNGIPFRSMANPNEFECADTYGGVYFNNGDIVHYDSGIQNYWYYLLCQGGSGSNDLGNNFNVSAIGMTDAMNIAYRNLAVYLTPFSTFEDSRTGSEQAASDLFGDCSDQLIQTANAWYAVGVGGLTNFLPMASFTVSPDFNCTPPLTAQFTNTSTNATSSVWDFGDGSISTLNNPSHIYNTAGSFNVRLIASGTGICGGSDTLVVANAINIVPMAPVANFSLSPSISTTNAPVSFSDISSFTPLAWSWDFGDGGTSALQNPIHSYTTAGTYTVRLIVQNCYSSDTIIQQVTVVEFNRMCYESSSSGSSGLLYDSGGPTGNYQNDEICTYLIEPLCEGPITLSFEQFNLESDFDYLNVFDGPNSSSTHLLSATGSFIPADVTAYSGTMFITFDSDYSVSYSGFKATWTSTSGSVSPVASFNASPDSLFVNAPVYFNDQSSNAITWNWDFGDGVTSSQENPVHTYSTQGYYTVTLVIENCGLFDTMSQQVFIHYNVGINDYELQKVSVFPNPFSTSITIQLSGNLKTDKAKLSLYEVTGRKVYEKQYINIENNSLQLTRDDLASGVYLLQMNYYDSGEEQKSSFIKLIAR